MYVCMYVCMYGILTCMYYTDLPNVGIPYMEPMGDRDYYAAITMFVCECACLYEQKCVVIKHFLKLTPNFLGNDQV